MEAMNPHQPVKSKTATPLLTNWRDSLHAAKRSLSSPPPVMGFPIMFSPSPFLLAYLFLLLYPVNHSINLFRADHSFYTPKIPPLSSLGFPPNLQRTSRLSVARFARSLVIRRLQLCKLIWNIQICRINGAHNLYNFLYQRFCFLFPIRLADSITAASGSVCSGSAESLPPAFPCSLP